VSKITYLVEVRLELRLEVSTTYTTARDWADSTTGVEERLHLLLAARYYYYYSTTW
jgi:hypothetical protein